MRHALFHASAAMHMRSSLFLDVRRRRLVHTDVAGQCVGPIFKGQAVQEGLDCVTLETGTDRLSRNVRTYQSMLPNIPEKRRFRLKVLFSKK